MKKNKFIASKSTLSISNQYITFRIMLQEVTNIISGKYITQTWKKIGNMSGGWYSKQR